MSRKQILNIAHRGFSSEYAENTMRAFDEGMKAGANGFECDLRLTADGHVVVFHDDDLSRLCGCKGSIESLNLSDVQKLKVLGKEPVPILEDLLIHFLQTTINLEIKASSRPSVIVESVLRILTKIRPQGRILISSFSHEVLRSLKVMDPERRLAERGILVETSELQALPSLQLEFEADTWNPPKQVFSAPWAVRWSPHKIPRLWTWTLDEPDLWASVLQSPLPVEAIITNRPSALAEFLRSAYC